MPYTSEHVVNICDDDTGDHLYVGPDGDTGDMLEIRYVDEDGKIRQRISAPYEQMKLAAEAILKLCTEKERET